MESFYFLVPIALIFVAIALRLLFWALNSGQYDNLDTEAHRILFDEDPKTKTADQPAVVQEGEQTGGEIASLEDASTNPSSPVERSHE